MKIENINNVHPVNQAKQKYTYPQEEQQKSKQNKDRIEISDEARKLQANSSLQAERLRKVEALRKQIKAGEYKIDPQKIAEKMASFYGIKKAD
ncbi:flagellar biosynthesis anti-sigma factor FlgM [Fictibacillus sp. Mic-4]|uniref:flagellar biosynthesis anti-sigma factor FlgM n=1 Tax=Fictibacillus TaxID=1329200 RepID=UPI0004205C45|nr:flagellar biosynthesis anti-sigma factor FlgM [Fictibacillus gelatini]